MTFIARASLLAVWCLAAPVGGQPAGWGLSQDAEPVDAAVQKVSIFETADVRELVWQGGRSAQPGLSKARRTERARERAERRQALAEFTTGSPEARLQTIEFLRDLFDDATSPEPLLDAALRTIGSLRLYELAPQVVTCLERPDRSSSSARVALHDLFGVWFAGAEEARGFLAALGDGPVPDVYLEQLRAHDARNRTQRIELAKLEPAAVTFDVLDPSLRVELARTLVESWNASGSVDEVTRLDFARRIGASAFEALHAERDVQAYDALLELVITTLESGGETSNAWDGLAAFLDETLVARADERSLTIARAFARFPWKGLAANDTQSANVGPESGLARIGRALEGLLTRVRWPEQPDEDAVLGVLDALGALCDRTRSAEIPEGLSESAARVPVFALIEDGAAAPVQRAAAVSTLRRMVNPADGPRLVRVLQGERDEPQLVHAVLGCLSVILSEFGEESDGAVQVLERIARWAVDDDPDLRRQALNLLENFDAELTAHVPVRLLLEQLGAEELDDLAAAKLRLIGRLGNRELLPELLALESFDDLVGSSPVVLDALLGAVQKLANGSSATRFRVARRLLAVSDDASGLTRLRRALELAATPGAEAELGPSEHADLVKWAWQLHAAGLEVSTVSPDLGARIVDVHVPALRVAASGEGGPIPPGLLGRAAHLEAVLRSTREAPDVAKVLALFAEGLERSQADVPVSKLILRDRARFLAVFGAADDAISDFRALGNSDVLRNSDLRLGVQLLERDLVRQAEHAYEASNWLWRLVRRRSWRSETTGVRWRDLEALATWAERSAQPLELWRRLQELLADLPSGPDASASPDSQAAWLGLERDDGGLERLRALSLRAATGVERATPPPVPPEDTATPTDG